jgi:hypothetical protein
MPYTLLASTNQPFIILTQGAQAVRIIVSTAMTGTGTITPYISLLYANPYQNVMIGATNGQIFDIIGATTLTDTQVSGSATTAAGVGNILSVAQFAQTIGAASGGSWAGIRTPTTFHTVQATASGNTAVWTPTTGKKFRLMRLMVQITGNATITSGAVLTVSFQDSTTATNIAIDSYIPASALTAADDFVSPWIDLGNGYLSAAANNVLNVNLSSALAAGNARIFVCGTEE